MMKSIQYLTLLLIACLMSGVLSAQSWKQLAKDGEKYFEQGKFKEAATVYDAAFQQKSSKKELSYLAGEAYYALGDYEKAAAAFLAVKSEYEALPLAGLKYARSLKNLGKFEAAKKELVYFIKKYSAPDKIFITEIVKNEVEGCEMGLKFNSDPSSATAEITHLGNGINTDQAEFAPIPFASDILYFASVRDGDGKAKIYRSRLESGEWSAAVEPNLPRIIGHVSQGSFSSDGNRFYFTVCNDQQAWKGIRSECDIYLTQRRDGVWNKPARLREYLKMDGTTAMHPFVVQDKKTETLYFTSNRSDGKGGLDIWFTTRELDSETMDFTFPQNAGEKINTIGDEISPFYDAVEGKLYFSSDGQPTVGGFDIFSIKGQKDHWQNLQHLGFPVNSTANDYQYTLQQKGGEAFLVSNRTFGDQKTTTTDTDIFTIGNAEKQLDITGAVKDQQSNELVTNFKATLYEVLENGQQRLLVAQTFDQSPFQFRVLPNLNLRVVVEKSSVGQASYNFNTHDYDTSRGYQKEFLLSGAKLSSPTKPTYSPVTPSTTSSNRITTPSVSPPVSTPVKSTPRLTKSYDGTYYKVQLKAVVVFDENSQIYDPVRSYGDLDIELLPARGWTRVLLSPFFSLQEAKNMISQARTQGFPDAFIVRYKNGERMTL